MDYSKLGKGILREGLVAFAYFYTHPRTPQFFIKIKTLQVQELFNQIVSNDFQ